MSEELEISDRLHLASGTLRNYLSSAMLCDAEDRRAVAHIAARIATEGGWL